MKPIPNKTYDNPLPPYSNMRNGDKLCSAHDIIVKVLDKQDRKLDEMDAKLDQLLTDKAIKDKELQDQTIKDNRAWGTRDKIITGVTIGVIVLLLGFIIEFNWKTFVLGI